MSIRFNQLHSKYYNLTDRHFNQDSYIVFANNKIALSVEITRVWAGKGHTLIYSYRWLSVRAVVYYK